MIKKKNQEPFSGHVDIELSTTLLCKYVRSHGYMILEFGIVLKNVRLDEIISRIKCKDKIIYK